ncbi:MAG: BrnT family toxin [Synergistaceae bacterium]|nr:BrnT family toxin [Synergistaceae bacterium]MBQ9595233.1 BrnT family toxin [Synergistaceae bacterium]MBR0205090.1 BrnT family toxin [Synergistaceae bacterium]
MKIEQDEIKLELGGMLFTWDDEKEKINIRKHGIDFTTAAAAFFDEDAVYESNSVDEITGEERFDIIGWLVSKLMFVVYVERITINGNDIIRVISAREATKEEKIRYVNGA